MIEKIYTGNLDNIRTQDPELRMAGLKLSFTGD
jgi:hypothetical protein